MNKSSYELGLSFKRREEEADLFFERRKIR